MSWLTKLGEESAFFPLWRWGHIPCRKPFSRRRSPSQQTLCEEQACFPILAFTLRAPEHSGRPVLSPEVEIEPPARYSECPPGGSALRCGGGHASEGSALIPGHLCPWRRPASQVRGRPGRPAFCACGVGSGDLDGMAGRRTSGGRRQLNDLHPQPPRAPLLLSIAGQSDLTPHPKCV